MKWKHYKKKTGGWGQVKKYEAVHLNAIHLNAGKLIASSRGVTLRDQKVHSPAVALNTFNLSYLTAPVKMKSLTLRLVHFLKFHSQHQQVLTVVAPDTLAVHLKWNITPTESAKDPTIADGFQSWVSALTILLNRGSRAALRSRPGQSPGSQPLVWSRLIRPEALFSRSWQESEIFHTPGRGTRQPPASSG